MICKNCGHKIIYSDEYDYWMHEWAVVKYEKDEEYDFCTDERYCAVGMKVDKGCGCKNPEPKDKGCL